MRTASLTHHTREIFAEEPTPIGPSLPPLKTKPHASHYIAVGNSVYRSSHCQSISESSTDEAIISAVVYLQSEIMPRKLCPTLIVIGGGFAGRAAIHHFITYVQDAQILLIDEKPYFEFSPAVLRCLVHPGHIRQITFPQHTDHDFAFLQGRVTHITAREVTVTRHINNSISIFAVPYDYCVWATGVDYAHPIRTPSWRRQPTVPRRRGEFGFFRHRVMSANQ